MISKKTKSINAVDNNGNLYVIYVLEYYQVVDAESGREIEHVNTSYKLINGDELKKESNGMYKIVRTGVIVSPM